MNLLFETKEKLADYGKTLEDVRWIECDGKEVPIELFCIEADMEYDNDYGSAEVKASLVIVGDGWWLERAEYDGSEWWEYKENPTKPTWTYGYDFTPFY